MPMDYEIRWPEPLATLQCYRLQIKRRYGNKRLREIEKKVEALNQYLPDFLKLEVDEIMEYAMLDTREAYAIGFKDGLNLAREIEKLQGGMISC